MTVTAQQRGIARCTTCGKLSRITTTSQAQSWYCTRCAAPLSFRQPHSLQRSWAYTLAAAFLMIPANILPVIKLMIIIILILAVQLHLPLSKQQCTVLYRFIHFIGRWSMLDLFMISILVTLVHLGNIATVESGPAATAFAAVVVLTLFAANSFDPRLLWDLDND